MRIAGVDLSLWVALATLSVLTCALVVGHVNEAGCRRAAEERAVVLLKQWLSTAQLAQYEKHGYFELTGGHSGKRYRIRPTRQMNVDELDEHGLRKVSYCFGPEGELPIGDVMLAQKIALENDEQTAIALANRGNAHRSLARMNQQTSHA